MKKPAPKVPPIGKDKAIFNYSNLITQKGYVKVSFESLEPNECYISSYSILKIFTLLNNSSQSQEQICINYITCAISNEESSEFEPSANGELAPVYVTLLNTSKGFYCNANPRNPPVMITDYSLKKVMSFLNETIVGMSDYISIAIFVLSEDEVRNRFKNLTKLSLRANILDKYGHNSVLYPLFNGKSNVPIILPHAEQNSRIDIADLDLFLDNAEAHLEQKPQKNRIFPTSSSSSARVAQSGSSKLIEKPLKYYKKNPRSKHAFSRPKNQQNIMSPFISSSGDSRKNSKDFLFMDNNNNFDSVSFTEDDLQIISPGKLKSTPKPRIYGVTVADICNKSNVNNNEEGSLPNEFYAVYDLGLERRLIPEKYIEMTMKALNEFIVNSDNINLFDNKKKIARLSSKELITKNRSLDDIWVEVMDINDNIVYVKRRALESKLKTHAINDLIKIDDFDGNNVFIKNTKALLVAYNSSTSTNKPSMNQASNINRNNNNSYQKRFFVVRLARIEIKDISAYYTPLNR